MVIGILTAQINLFGITSLKDKRSIVKSLIGRLQSRFNASVSETARMDSHQVAVIGMAVVSNDAVFVNQQLDAILNFMRKDGRFYMGQTHRETFSSKSDFEE